MGLPNTVSPAEPPALAFVIAGDPDTETLPVVNVIAVAGTRQ